MVTVLTIALVSAMSLFSPVHIEALAAENPSQSIMRMEKSTRRGWLGVSVQDLTPRLAKANGNQVTEGALVNEVERKSPADSAGIEEGDVIVEFDGRKIYDADDLSKVVGRTKPGTTVTIVIDRKGKMMTLKATIGRIPSRRTQAYWFRVPGERLMIGRNNALGAELRPLSKQLAEYFQVPDGKGVLVESVEKNGAADKAGMKAGDVIVKIGKERVASLKDIWEALEDYDEGERVEIEVIRKGVSKKLTVEIEDGAESDFYEFHIGPQLRLFRDLGRDLRRHINPGIELDYIYPHLEEFKHELERWKDELRLERRVEIPVPQLRAEPKQRRTI
jgi:C-terminal processing protease CtpA/Prc